MAETSYAPCGDLSLAYQVFGDGPVELVFVGPMVTHIELFWTLPEFKAFFDGEQTAKAVEGYRDLGVERVLLDLPAEPQEPTLRRLDEMATELAQLA